MRANIYSAMLCVSLLCHAAWSEDEPVLRIYDVMDLVTELKDRPSPQMDGSLPGPVLASPGVFGAPVPAFTIQSVADMLRNRIKPESWDPNLGTSIEERAGMLIIVQKPSIHALIQGHLGKFRAAAHPRLSLQALMVDLDQQNLFPFLGRTGKGFGEKEVQTAVENGTLKGMPQFLAYNAQRGHVLAGVCHNLTDAREMEGNLEPVRVRVLEGTIFDATAMLSPDGVRATIEVRLTVQSNVKIKEIEIARMVPLGPITRSKLEFNPPRMINQEVPPEVPRLEENKAAAQDLQQTETVTRVEKATFSQRKLRLSLDVRVGEWTLAGILPPGAPDKLHTLAFVRVSRIED